MLAMEPRAAAESGLDGRATDALGATAVPPAAAPAVAADVLGAATSGLDGRSGPAAGGVIVGAPAVPPNDATDDLRGAAVSPSAARVDAVDVLGGATSALDGRDGPTAGGLIARADAVPPTDATDALGTAAVAPTDVTDVLEAAAPAVGDDVLGDAAPRLDDRVPLNSDLDALGSAAVPSTATPAPDALGAAAVSPTPAVAADVLWDTTSALDGRDGPAVGGLIVRAPAVPPTDTTDALGAAAIPPTAEPAEAVDVLGAATSGLDTRDVPPA